MEDLIEVFGRDFLGYVLAYDLTQPRLSDLSAEQLGVVELLRPISEAVKGANPFQRAVSLADVMLRYDEQHATTFANLCRRHSGGVIPTIDDTADELRNLLLRMGGDLYPGFLLPSYDRATVSSITLGSGAFAHPLRGAICKAILADAQLGAMFPETAAGLNLDVIETLLTVYSHQFIWESGSAQGVQLIGLSESLMSGAYYRCLPEGMLESERYLSQLEEILNDLRGLVSGESRDISVLFWFSNVNLPPNTAIKVPWGHLCSPERFEATLLPKGSGAGAVLVAKRPLRILYIDRSEPQLEHPDFIAKFEHFGPQMQQWAAQTDRISDLMRFAFLLASPPEGFYAVRVFRRSHIEPLQSPQGTGWASMALPFTPSPEVGLGAETLGHVVDWSERVKDHPRGLDIAMRRTLTAITERSDPLDGFIDAVLAWENMFSGYPETNLRVCGAIAWLLEPGDHGRRSALFKELKGIYNKRSALVHGSSDSLSDPINSRNRAVRIAVDSMRRLYEYKDLLALKDSAERGGMIIMGAASRLSVSAAETADSEPRADSKDASQ